MKSSTELAAALALTAQHQDHLLTEGFTEDIIRKITEAGLVRSLSLEEAAKDWHQVRGEGGEGLTGGLLFTFSETFSQLRTDDPEAIQKPGEKLPRYLSPAFPIDSTCAYIPQGCRVITEGMKDALAFFYIGGIPTGAIAGVSHAVKALPAGCGYTIIFDADAWENERVFIDLIKAGVHCGGKVNILPTIEGQSKAGGCEYFKAGFTAAGYQKLVDEALTPTELYEAWLTQQNITSVAGAAKVAVFAGKVFGAIHGYATSTAKGEIKTLLKSPLLSQYGLEFHAVCGDSFNTKETKRAHERAEDGTDIETLEIALGLVKSNAVLFHSPEPDSVEYAEIPTVNNSFKTVPVGGSEFKKWLRGEYYSVVGAGIPSEEMSIIIETAKAIAAFDSPELPVSNQRIAKYDGRYFIYLADEAHTVIEYGAKGWNPCANSPVKFVFDKYKSPMPAPCRGGSIDDLWKFSRISNTADRLLVISYLVKALVPGGTDPILALGGYQDSGKSTAAKYIRMLVDPFDKSQCLAKIPAESDSIAIHSQQRRILSFDNLSHITKDQSDFLCGVATGTGISKRKLYSDGEEILLDIQNLILMTSIGQVIKEADLLSRSLVIDMSRMTAEERGEDEAMAAEYERLSPQMLGALLDITCQAIDYRDRHKATFKQYTRFGAFSLLGKGVEQHLKYPEGTLEKRISAGVEIAHQITIEASPVGSTIASWLTSDIAIWRDENGTEFKHYWQGNMSQLLIILKNQAKKSESAATIPKNANALGIELKRIEAALLYQNIELNQTRDKHGRYMSIKLLKEVENISSTPTVSLGEIKFMADSLSSLSSGENETIKPSAANGSSDDKGIEIPCHHLVIDGLENHQNNPRIDYLEGDTADDKGFDDTKNQDLTEEDSKLYSENPLSSASSEYPELDTEVKNENRCASDDKAMTRDFESLVIGSNTDSENNRHLSEKVDDKDDKENLNNSSAPNTHSTQIEYLTKPQDPNDSSTFDHVDEV
jgi:hypothetical protein